jgi:hypothetical protein
MTQKNQTHSYTTLSEHTFAQTILFYGTLLLLSSVFFYFVALPLLSLFFEDFLTSIIVRESFTKWTVTVIETNGNKSIYSLNPLLSFIPFSFSFGFIVTFYISATLPLSVGYIHQKLLREVINSADTVVRVVYHQRVNEDHTELEQRLTRMSTRELHEIAALFNVEFDELETLQKSLIWKYASGLSKILSVQHAIRMYMRHYFTVKYSNHALGVVYIGAAILIGVIGLRGLKFIPATQPSVIIFALALEFALLIFYAITIIYTRESEQQSAYSSASDLQTPQQNDQGIIEGQLPESIPTPKDFSLSQRDEQVEMERLLRLFIAAPMEKQNTKKKRSAP